MRYSYVAKAVVVGADGKFLVLRRSSSDEQSPGRVDLPGGGVEPGESYDVSAMREIAEEAGISIPPDQLDLAYTMTRKSTDGSTVIVRFLFIAKADSNVVTLSHEHDAYRWLDLEGFKLAMNATAWGEGIEFLAKNGLIS